MEEHHWLEYWPEGAVPLEGSLADAAPQALAYGGDLEPVGGLLDGAGGGPGHNASDGAKGSLGGPTVGSGDVYTVSVARRAQGGRWGDLRAVPAESRSEPSSLPAAGRHVRGIWSGR